MKGWLSSLVVRALDSQLDGRGLVIQFPAATALLGNNLRRVVCTHVPLSPSNVTWYQQKLGRIYRHTTWYTSPVSVVSQRKLVSGWGIRKRRSAPPYGPMGSGKTLFFYISPCQNCLVSAMKDAIMACYKAVANSVHQVLCRSLVLLIARMYIWSCLFVLCELVAHFYNRVMLC